MIRHLNIFTWQLIFKGFVTCCCLHFAFGNYNSGCSLYHISKTIACYLLHGICSLFYSFKTTKCIRFLLIGTLRRYVVDMTLRGDRLLMSIKIFLTKDLVKSHYTMSMIYICLFFMSPSFYEKGTMIPKNMP